jgi:alkaline phosphatase
MKSLFTKFYPGLGAFLLCLGFSDGTLAQQRPRNIILIIGDGMGLHQVSASYLQQTLREPSESWNMARFPYVGLASTVSFDALITDSGAGATALSTGRKTYNGAVGVGSDTMPLPTLLELAAKAGKKTGMLVTSEVTHATPASFAAHRKNRDLVEDIALDLSRAPLDWLVGGGRNHFVNRQDQRDLLYEMSEASGVLPVNTTPEILSPKLRPIATPLIGLLWDGPAPSILQGRDPQLMSMLATRACRDLDRVHRPDVDSGFFLMIEGSQIDWGGHANDGDYVITETQDLDRVVGAVLDFAQKDGQTLVVLTADHETGGMAIQSGARDGSNMKFAFTTKKHTPVLVPVLAYGPGAERFAGWMDNTDIPLRMAELWALPLR